MLCPTFKVKYKIMLSNAVTTATTTAAAAAKKKAKLKMVYYNTFSPFYSFIDTES